MSAHIEASAPFPAGIRPSAVVPGAALLHLLVTAIRLREAVLLRVKGALFLIRINLNFFLVELKQVYQRKLVLQSLRRDIAL